MGRLLFLVKPLGFKPCPRARTDTDENMWVLEPLIVILKPRGEKPAKNGANNEEVDLRNREKLSPNPII